jgi:hypothetical protein
VSQTRPTGRHRKRKGVLNSLVQTGYKTTEPNHSGTQRPQGAKNTTQTAEKPRPGASSRVTAQHARIRPPPAETATTCTTGAKDTIGGGRASAVPMRRPVGRVCDTCYTDTSTGTRVREMRQICFITNVTFVSQLVTCCGAHVFLRDLSERSISLLINRRRSQSDKHFRAGVGRPR